ncbi:Cyclophilin-like family protein [compost metagenome]
MKIEFTSNGKTATADLVDSSATRDFIALLPMTLTLEDYASTEKISPLPKRLSTDGAPPGITPVAGDLAYYAPWGNLALFYKDFRYSEGLVRLGHIETGLDVLVTRMPLEVVIKRVEP